LRRVEPQVFDLLEFLVRNRHRVVSRDDLLTAIWNGRIVSEATLTSRINAARAAVDDNGQDQRLIRTVQRKGIRFAGAIREESGSSAAPKGGVAESVASALSLPDKPSIAVLPFTNMSGNAEEDYFADGMAEEIITALSRVNWLFVIARNSSFIYKGRAVDIRQVGRDLGVRYVLEGSIRRGGTRLRFTGQLIEATTGVHIWANRFEGNVGDVFALQDLFTASVVAAIEPKLRLAEIERLKHKPATNLDAYDLFLRAQHLDHQYSEQSIAGALHNLEQALAIDPTFAQAAALSARCHAVRVIENWTKDAEKERRDGQLMVQRAIELGSDDANVLWMSAQAVLTLQGDARRASELAHRSLQLNPNSAVALAETGRIETALGNADRALELLTRAERLSPCDPKGWFIATRLAFAHYMCGHYHDAAAAAERALHQNPRAVMAAWWLAASLIKQGRQNEVAEIVQRLLAVEPQLTLANLRRRILFIEDRVWRELSEPLRLAGLPE
jgi:TolB-like protein/TolA-binding protein